MYVQEEGGGWQARFIMIQNEYNLTGRGDLRGKEHRSQKI